VHKVDNVIQIKSDRLIDPIIVYSSRSASWVTANWSEHLALIPNAILEKLRDDVIQFDFKGTLKTPIADVPSSQLTARTSRTPRLKIKYTRELISPPARTSE
jgi:hypothetical protein